MSLRPTSSKLAFLAVLAALWLAGPRTARADDEKTLSFERPLFLDDKGGTGKVKHLFRLPGVDGDWDASLTVTLAGTAEDAAKERSRWLRRFKDKGGEPLDPQTVAEVFEGASVKGELTTAEGQVEERWTKALAVALEGPDGVWLVRLEGGVKTVDKHRDDFLKFARSAKSAAAPAAVEDWRPLVARAAKLLDAGKGFAKAAPLVKRALELAPEEPQVKALSGELLYLDHQPDEAYKALTAALKADPQLGRARRTRAYISIERRVKNQTPAAPEFAEDLDQAIAAFPDDLRLHDARARERYMRQKWREALEDLDVILAPEARKNGDQGAIADLLRARAFCRIKIRDFEKALEDCKEAIAVDPKNGVGYRFLGVVELEHGDAKSAIKAFEKAVELLKGEDRNDAKILVAEAKEKSGDLDGALDELESFVEDNPKSKFVKRANDALTRVRAAIQKRDDKKDKKQKDDE